MVARKRLSIATEHEEQVQLMTWIRLNTWKCSDLSRTFAVPNGGHRNKVAAAKLKAEGVQPGILDLFLPCPVGGFHGLWIEMKRRKGGRLTSDQRDWIDYLRTQGYRVEICKGWEEARDVLVDYLRLDNEH